MVVARRIGIARLSHFLSCYIQLICKRAFGFILDHNFSTPPPKCAAVTTTRSVSVKNRVRKVLELPHKHLAAREP